jgi:hypothetical protein
MSLPDGFEKFQQNRGGWHGPMPRLPAPPAPEPGLSFLARLRWHMREYLRPKSKEERLAIRFAKNRED